MGAQGTAVLDFGAFPGSNVAVLDVAASGVVSTSAVEAWIRPAVSADHSATDHVAAPMRVVGRYLSDGNIRITGMNINETLPPIELVRRDKIIGVITRNFVNPERARSPMLVGQYNVNWVWN